MLLNDLLASIGIEPHSSNIDVSGLAIDSRKAGKGFFFIALKGAKTHGLLHLEDAFKNGAVGAFVPEDAENLPDLDMTFIRVKDLDKAVAVLARTFYPKQPKTMVCVTGTNGKTSTVNFARLLWKYLGKKSASVGTLGVVADDIEIPEPLTTPDVLTLHQRLHMLAEKGVDFAAVEASSHGIEQRRLDGFDFAAAGFTNITRDHLDYHKTMEHYFNTKKHLFDMPLSSKTAVLNADVPEFSKLRMHCERNGLRVIDYGKNADVIRLVESQMEPFSQTLKLNIAGRFYQVSLPLAGAFQAMNALCAMGLLMAAGEDIDALVDAMAFLKGAKGRLEFIGAKFNGASVYVDYAHTPDALKTVLTALRPHTKNRLDIVFGCG